MKTRFDQIFESTRYTKALDDIRKQRKDRMAELKELEHTFSMLAVTVNNMRKESDMLEGQKSRKDELTDTIENLTKVWITQD